MSYGNHRYNIIITYLSPFIPSLGTGLTGNDHYLAATISLEYIYHPGAEWCANPYSQLFSLMCINYILLSGVSPMHITAWFHMSLVSYQSLLLVLLLTCTTFMPAVPQLSNFCPELACT
jgi:hypothetical protein